ncbi:TonB-dependent receptor; Outer membrane receptor for ferrienterochelin and colicins [hydrothermal vent metagenome]|uniref:TonB-dependent receptor Outer membrane receptor for ferrienterochelin and colicins n=1 Tax=hydrothermal vent metagenome TaxID=652676 RepID=A0A3B0XAY9_9ZZZZ
MNILKNILILLFLLAHAFPSAAEMANEDETLQLVYGDERMVSIATGNEQLLYKAPAIASVITRKDIENSSANNLNELLEMIPGLHISEDYFSGDAVYSMRGFFRDPDAGMLFLINGTTVNTLEKGSRFSALRMALNNIEQIEIIRGPGSAVYGADAFVGVINIITKKYQPGQTFGIQAGSFSTAGAWLQNNFRLGQWESHVSLQYQSAKGDKNRIIENDLQSFLDDVTGTSSSIAPNTLTSEYNTLDLELNFANGNWNINQWLWMNQDQSNGHGTPALDTLDATGQLDSRASLSAVEYANDSIAKNWSLNLRLSFLDYALDRNQYLLPAGSIAPVGDDGNLFTSGIRNTTFPNGMISFNSSKEQQTHFDITSFFYGWRDHSLRLSSGYQLQKYSSNEARNFGPGVLDSGQSTALNQPINITNSANLSLPDGERKIFYASLQDEWNFSADWTLTTGVRYDDYSDFGNTVNPRIALVWQTRYNLSTKLLYGRAFRAPVYKELNLQNQLGFNGNNQLQPETIDTLEFAIDHRPNEKIRNTFSLFAQRAKDLIFAVEDTQIANTFTFENSGTQEGYGVEAETSWQAAKSLNVSANYAWQFNKLLEQDIETPYSPSQQLYARAIWNMSNYWVLTPELHFIGERPRALGEVRAPISSSTRLDLTLKYQNHYNNWDASLRIRNLLDADLSEPSIGNNSISGGAALANDVPLEGIRVLAEFRYFVGK